MYQIEAVRRVVEKFAEKKRKALLVQATGTGKTRVAVSLCDAMVKANWAKRILFLCDRRELRRQANNAFNEFLPSLPRTYVTGNSSGNTKDRIFLSTYPAMMKIYETFDVGFFDLIIADESHRSLYNRYRQIFEYFDSYQLGLTATPVDFVTKNTFDMFECDPGETPKTEPTIIDVKEDESQVERKKHKVRLDKLDDLDMAAYRNRVNNVLQAIIDQNETLRKIRLGQPVTENDLEDLCSLVLVQEPGLDLHDLMDYFKQAESLDEAIREIIGMDADAVQQRFTEFVQAHPNLASHQIKFLDLLQNHIAKYGSIKTDDLYQPPFTTLHTDSLDGLFDEPLADEIFAIIGSFQKVGK